MAARGRIGHHQVYLAVIAVLILLLVYAGGRGVRAHHVMKEVEERFGGDGRASTPRSGPLRDASAADLGAEKTYEERRAEVDGLVEKSLELGEFGGPSKLTEACARALRGGKRLRPIIVMEVARAAETATAAAVTVDPADTALAVEYLHAASLAIDDLPDFDDDAERRGEPAVHAATSPAVAQMAALSLVAAAFQDVARQVDWIRDNCPEFKGVDRVGTRLAHDIACAIGARGAAGGQFMDTSLSAKELEELHGDDGVIEIMRLKTAALFEVSFLAGWLVANGDGGKSADIRRAGRHFGTAFQAADDLGDMAQDAARQAAGKPGWNYANEYGAEEATQTITRGLNACRLILTENKLFTPLWREIYAKVWEMSKQ